MDVTRYRHVRANPVAVPEEQQRQRPEEATYRVDIHLDVRRQRVHRPVHR